MELTKAMAEALLLLRNEKAFLTYRKRTGAVRFRDKDEIWRLPSYDGRREALRLFDAKLLQKYPTNFYRHSWVLSEKGKTIPIPPLELLQGPGLFDESN